MKFDWFTEEKADLGRLNFVLVFFLHDHMGHFSTFLFSF